MKSEVVVNDLVPRFISSRFLHHKSRSYESTGPDYLSGLPRELTLRILACLDAKELIKTQLVSRYFAELSTDEWLWSRQCALLMRYDHYSVVAQPGETWKHVYMTLLFRNRNWADAKKLSTINFPGSSHIFVVRMRGGWLLTANNRGQVSLWNLRSGRCLYETIITRVICIELAVDDGVYAAGSELGLYVIWDLKTGQEIRRAEVEGKYINCISVKAGKIAIGDAEGKIEVCDLMSGEKEFDFNTESFITGLHLNPTAIYAMSWGTTVSPRSIHIFSSDSLSHTVHPIPLLHPRRIDSVRGDSQATICISSTEIIVFYHIQRKGWPPPFSVIQPRHSSASITCAAIHSSHRRVALACSKGVQSWVELFHYNEGLQMWTGYRLQREFSEPVGNVPYLQFVSSLDIDDEELVVTMNTGIMVVLDFRPKIKLKAI